MERIGFIFGKFFAGVFKSDRNKVFARSECGVAYIRYAFRNDNRRNRGIVEYVTADGFYCSFSFDGFGNDVLARNTAREVSYFDFGIFTQCRTEQNAVQREITLVLFVNVDFFKLASAEHVAEIIYLGHIFADVDIIEISDRSGSIFGVESIFFVIHNRTYSVYVESSEFGSASERILFDNFKVFRQSKLFYFAEAVESLSHYGKVAVACLALKHEFGNRAAAHESFFVDESHVCGNGKLGDLRALESAFAYGKNSVRNCILGCSSFREIDDGVKLLGGLVQLAQNAVNALVVCVVRNKYVLHFRAAVKHSDVYFFHI